jgi:hypothetical protein
VTGQSLKTFLYNAMPEFLPEEVKNAVSFDLQPFVRADDGMVFRRLTARPKHEVRLTTPAGTESQNLKIWTGQPHTQVVSERLAGNEWTGALVRGLYVAEIPAAGLRQGFQVSGAGAVEVAITQQGPEVIPSDGSELFGLDVVAENPAASITVTDHRFERVYAETGELHEHDAAGVYKIRVEFGRNIGTASEEVLLLDRDFVNSGSRRVAAAQLPSPAPIPGSGLTPESHMEAFSDAADRRGVFAAPTPAGATISIMARYRSDPTRSSKGQPTFPHPMEGLELRSAQGAHIAYLSEHCRVDRADVEPVAIWEREVRPGVYFLRQVLSNGRAFEGSVVACPNWITQVAIRRANIEGASDADSTRVGVIDEVAIFMRATGGSPRSSDQDAVIEAARLALAQGRNLFAAGRGSELQELLLNKYDDPIAGIIGSHLLLLAMDANGDHDPERAEQFDTTVKHLRRLVGLQHPDIEALSLRCADAALRTTAPFTVPPMFHDSWRLITDASYEQPGLVPPELWQRVHASTRVGACSVWAVDEQTRAGHARQLSGWISEYARQAGSGSPGTGTGALPEAVRDAARRLHVPAAAAAVLWDNHAAPQQPV